MTLHRHLLTGVALALALTSCAGADKPAAPAADAVEASEDATPAEDDTHEGETAAASGEVGHDEEETTTAADEHDEDMAAHDQDEAADEHTDTDGTAVTDEHVDRVVEIGMEDIRFSVEELEFTVGERVLFVFENVGAAPHEALIGDMHVQDEHEEEMKAGGGHHDDGGHHGDLSMLSLESGESGSFVHEFTEAGELWMGCHVPGHWDAGMRTRITVTG